MNKKQAALLLLTVVVAAFFRLYRLNTAPPGFNADEATDGVDAVTAWRTGDFRPFYPENNGRGGLFINLVAVTYGLIGQSQPWVVRLPSALLGTLTVLGVYALARQSSLQRTAWLAAWFMATGLWYIDLSRTGGPRVGAAACLVWSLWLGQQAIIGATRNSNWSLWAILAGAVYGLGFYTYSAYFLTPLLMLIVFSRQERQAACRVAALSLVATVLTILPLAIFVVQQPNAFFHRVNQLSGFAVTHPIHDFANNAWRTVGMLNLAGDLNPRHNIPGRAMLFWPVGFLFLVGVGVAVRRHHWLLWWLGIGLLPAIIVPEGVPHAGRALLAGPAAYLLAALGAEFLIQKAEPYRWRAVVPRLTLLLAVAVALEGYCSYFVVWARDPRVAEWFDSSLVQVASRLDALPRELPKYVILDPDPMTVRGLPFAAQTIMFLTDTATRDRQQDKNLHYLWPDQTNQIARGYVYVCHIETTRP